MMNKTLETLGSICFQGTSAGVLISESRNFPFTGQTMNETAT